MVKVNNLQDYLNLINQIAEIDFNTQSIHVDPGTREISIYTDTGKVVGKLWRTWFSSGEQPKTLQQAEIQDILVTIAKLQGWQDHFFDYLQYNSQYKETIKKVRHSFERWANHQNDLVQRIGKYRLFHVAPKMMDQSPYIREVYPLSNFTIVLSRPEVKPEATQSLPLPEQKENPILSAENERRARPFITALVRDKKVSEIELLNRLVEEPELIDLMEYCQNNAYIHGTSSIVFATLPQTNHSLIPLWNMLQQKKAPLGGEIILGGTAAVIVEGQVCFGRLKDNPYSLSVVKRGYAKASEKYDVMSDKVIQQMKMNTIECLEKSWLTTSLIFAIRAKLLGVQLLNKEGQHSIREYLHQMRVSFQISYRLAEFIAKYIKPLEGSEQPNTDRFARDRALFVLQKQLEEFVKSNEFDAKHFSLEKYLKEERLPENDTHLEKLNTFLRGKGYQLSLQAETAEEIKPRKAEKEISIQMDRYKTLVNTFTRTEDMQMEALRNPQKALVWLPSLNQIIDPFLEKVEQHLDLLEEMLCGDENLELSEESKQYLVNPFPLIFISNDSAAFTTLKSEFRSSYPVQLGSTIKYIATPKEHLESVKAYLNQHHLQDVRVVSMEDLTLFTDNA